MRLQERAYWLAKCIDRTTAPLQADRANTAVSGCCTSPHALLCHGHSKRASQHSVDCKTRHPQHKCPAALACWTETAAARRLHIKRHACAASTCIPQAARPPPATKPTDPINCQQQPPAPCRAPRSLVCSSLLPYVHNTATASDMPNKAVIASAKQCVPFTRSWLGRRGRRLDEPHKALNLPQQPPRLGRALRVAHAQLARAVRVQRGHRGRGLRRKLAPQ